MFPKTNSIIIFCFFFASIQCHDWCLLIAPDGNYRELGITRHWKTTDENSVEYVMYNRVGNEWVFDISAEKIIRLIICRFEWLEEQRGKDLKGTSSSNSGSTLS